MKSKNSFLYILPLLLVVFVSGCVGGGGGATGEGLVIKNLKVTPSTAFKQDRVFVDFTLENRGSSDAKRMISYLEANDRLVSFSNPSLPTTALSGVVEGLTPQSVTVQTTGLVLDEPISTGTFSTPVTLYVYYDYETEAAKSFTVVSTDELRRINEGGDGTLLGTAQKVGGEGPVSVSIQSLDVARAGPNRQLTISIKLQNTGPVGGVVTQSRGGGIGDRDFLVRLEKIEVLGNSLGSCSANIPEVRVQRNDFTTVPCVIQLPANLQFTETGIIKAKITYTYRVQSTVNLQIQGSKTQ